MFHFAFNTSNAKLLTNAINFPITIKFISVTPSGQSHDTSYDKQVQTQEGMLSSTKSQISGEINPTP